MRNVGFMKFIIWSVIISLILVSCGFNSQLSSIQPSATSTSVAPIAVTGTSVSQSPVPKNTETLRIENTPTNIAKNAIMLSQLNTGNVELIQPLFTHHVSWDAISYGLIAISPNSKWVALATKYSSQLY